MTRAPFMSHGTPATNDRVIRKDIMAAIGAIVRRATVGASLAGIMLTGTLLPSPGNAQQVEVDRELSYAQQGSHINLDPMTAEDLDSWNLIELMLRGLVQVDDNLQLGPDLATYTLRESRDRIRVTFKLRDAQWAGSDLDGNLPVTAKDVEYSLAKARGRVANKTASPQVAGLMEGILKWEVDGDAIHIDFAKDQWRADTLGQFINLRLMSREQAIRLRKLKMPWTGKPWSTGPYMVQSKTGGTVRLTRRRDLGNAGPAIEVVHREHRSDTRAVKTDLIIGNTDLMMDLSPKDADDISSRAESKAARESTPSLSYTFIGMNHRAPLLGDVRLRRALSMMVDKDALIRSVFDRIADAAIPVTGPYDPHLAGTYDPDLEPLYDFDPDAARALLDEVCGPAPAKGSRRCNGKPLTLRLIFNGDVERSRRIAYALEEMIEAYGITLELEGLNARRVGQRLTAPQGRAGGDFDLILMTHALSLNFDPYADWHSEGLSNYWSFSDAHLDGLLERQRTADAQLRHDLLAEVHGAMYDQQAALFLWSRKRFIAINRRFTNVDPKRVDFFGSLVEWGIDMKRLSAE